jgi:antitoxin (DNA-binding transcriptional repressor) of toxin-antitoxin stability system
VREKPVTIWLSGIGLAGTTGATGAIDPSYVVYHGLDGGQARRRDRMWQQMCVDRRIRMSTVTLEEAQARLPEIIAGLRPGQTIVITHNGEEVAHVCSPGPRPGNCRGMLTIVSEDEEHLKDFAEYVP